MSEIRLVDRDRLIMREIDRWRVVQGKHIRELVGFSGQRACDRRLRKLIEAGYIKRERILYGVAGIYRNTEKARKIGGLPDGVRKIRVEQIVHDIAVLDTVIYFKEKYEVAFDQITTEIELHRQDGFGIRYHRPDFVFKKNNKTYCVEVELTLKSKDRFEKIIRDNFTEYNIQIWIVPSMESKITKTLKENAKAYPNIRIIDISEVEKWKT